MQYQHEIIIFRTTLEEERVFFKWFPLEEEGNQPEVLLPVQLYLGCPLRQ